MQRNKKQIQEKIDSVHSNTTKILWIRISLIFYFLTKCGLVFSKIEIPSQAVIIQ